MNKRSLRASLRATASFKFALGVGLGITYASGTALANPTGGTVSTGAATITTPASSQTQINQTSQGVVINWGSFNIGSTETTKFVQPNATAIAVNRIGGSSASQIQGALLANGRIVLINPNGVAFGSHSTVNVGSLIATTTGASDSDALAGKFTTNGNQNASISNQGNITAASGYVALVAPHVSNTGTVTATLGDVTLAAANSFTIDLNGDGLVSFALPGTVTSGASVTNGGSLIGKNVTLSAQAAQSAATGVINTTGLVQATAVANVGGQIVLDGGSGVVNIGGTLKASSGASGGKIRATGAAVGLTSATIDASGTSGGGSILLGNGGVASVDSHSTLNASATSNGDGGVITINAAKNTIAGKALARGGATSGNGGTIATIGNTLNLAGFSADTSAPHGKTGVWIASAPSWSVSSQIASLIQTNLATTNVFLATTSSTGDIQVSSNLGWGGANGLTLDAMRNLSVTNNTTLTDSGTGGLSLIAGNDLSLANKATIISGGPLSLMAGHDITLANQATLKATGAATISLVAVHDISLANQGAIGGGAAVTLASGDNISLSSQASIATTGAGALTLDAYQNISGSGQASIRATGHGGIILHAGDANLAPPAAVSTTSAATTSAKTANAPLATASISTASPANAAKPASATGTITLSGSVQIDATGGGSIALYYNPTALGQPTNFGSFVSVSGGGTIAAYQLIHSLADLQAISGNLSGSYALGNDIDASSTAGWNAGAGFVPLGSAATPFTGNFDGQNFTISNLTIDLPTSTDVGLFGLIGAASSVGNLAVLFANVTGGNNVGILAGENDGTVVHDASSGTVKGIDFTDDTTNGYGIGGLVGANTGLVNFSASSASVTGFQNVGGLVGGDFSNGTTGSAITNSFATGNVAAVEDANEIAIGISSGVAGGHAGGLLGGTPEVTVGLAANLALTVANDYATGNVSGDQFAGGLIGYDNNGTITNVYATGDVSGAPSGASDQGMAGLIGFLSNIGATPTLLSNAWASGNVSGGVDVGGLVGQEKADDLITNTHASGNVSGDQPGAGNIGGLVGRALGNVSNSYSTGSVSGTSNVGGLVGQLGYETINGPNPAYFNISGSIANSWTSSTVSGNGNVGAFVGRVQPGASNVGASSPAVSGAYYNTDLAGGNPAFGAGDLSAASATGLTTVQMETASSFTFASDFGALGSGKTWVIVDQDGSLNNAGGAAGGTMPMLLSEYSTTIVNAHELQLMALDLTATYTIGTDINAAGTAGGDVWGAAGFIPVGGNNAGANFTGTLNGNGNTIDGLFINDSTTVVQIIGLTTPTYSGVESYGEAGLFGVMGAGASVDNLAITNASVTGGDFMGAGVLAGSSEGAISGVVTSGSVHVGNGLLNAVGQPNNSNSAAGGLLSALFDVGTVTDSSSSANVSGGNGANVGGLIGAAVFGGTITNAHASGSASTGNSLNGTYNPGSGAGGLIGIIYDLVGVLGSQTVVDNTYATGNATGGLTGPGPVDVGGLVGFAGGGGLIENSYATGNVTVGSGRFFNPQNVFFTFAGGLIGDTFVNVSNNLSATITQSYATGSVTGGFLSMDGGFIGDNAGAISDSYATGSVHESGPPSFAFTGGFAGYNDSMGSIANSYTTASVQPFPGSQGGFVGNNLGSLAGDYWDITTGIANTAQGAGNVANAPGVTGLTDSQIRTSSSFAFASDFGTLGSGATWVIVDQDGSLNNAGGAAGGTTPMLLSEYSTNIVNAHQLQLMALDLTATYTIGTDINAAGTAGGDVWGAAGFIPVGGNNAGANFTGTLNGNGNTIDGLFINDSTTVVQIIGLTTPTYSGVESYGEAGLFGVMGAGASVDNLAITNASVTGGDFMGAGVLAGSSEGAISGVVTSGSVHVGNGLLNAVGQPNNSNSAAGGLLSALFDVGTVTDSSSSANVSGGNGANVGGLIGAAVFGGTITNAHASGSASTGNSLNGTYNPGSGAGGLIGIIYDLVGVLGSQTVVDNTYATGNATGGLTGPGPVDVGGLVGFAGGGGLIENSYATGNVTVGSGRFFNPQNVFFTFAGGLIGDTFVNVSNNLSATITQSYATGSVTGGFLSMDGGFIGDNAGAISDSYATGSVHESGPPSFAFTGGFAGYNDSMGSIANSYTTASVQPFPGSQGGFVGNNLGSLAGDYWDITTGIANTAQGAGNVANAPGVTGLTDSQIRTSSSFAFASDFGTLGSGATWVIVDQDGSLNNAGGAAGGTTPMLLSEYSTNIVNAHQLQLMALDLTANYTLAGNINVASTAGGDVWGAAGFIPVGGNNAGSYFTGTLNGNGNAIDGLYINDTTTVVQYAGPTTQNFPGVEGYGAVGLFGVIGAGGLVEDLNLTNVNVSGGDLMGVGALADVLFGTVENASSSGSVQVGNGLVNVVGAGSNNEAGAGGLVSGVFTTGLIDNSSSSANVSGGNGADTGGLVGAMVFGGSITNSHASGNVSTGGSINGTNQYLTGTGGLVGIVFDQVGQLGTASLIDNSYATGSVSGELTGIGPVGVGGLVGTANGGGLIENSYATGNVTAGMGHYIDNQTIYWNDVGGFIGGLFININNLSATVSNSYSTGNVQAGSFSFVGGFVGFNQGTISDTYATGTVSGSLPAYYGFLGGFAGTNFPGGSISNSYANSAVLSYPGPQGGFVGFAVGGTFSGDYWNLTTGIVSPAQGAGNVANQSEITGLSTAQLQSGLPGGLDDGFWSINASINNGLPYLIALVP